ncbi:MAG: DUF72 domain-containing protein [Anaerolineae bacterium]|nr:DUF72 domain-containing protein [Anaerolineae bacterium]
MIYLGTSGYSYDDWKGVVYPGDLPRQEWLAYYSTEFHAVELNFTYYRIPTTDQMQKLDAQTPDGFCFTVKAHQDITHNRRGDPAPFVQLRAVLGVLQRRGKLGAVLLQFPYSFRNVKENVYYLQHCVKLLADLPLVVEFRNNDWLTQRTLNRLREWKVGFCNVDMPKLPGLLPKTAFVTAATSYVRFHGRNKEKWWQHDHAWERYDYSYRKDELEEWIPHLVEMNEHAENLFIFANNHWQGQSVSTVRQIRMLLERHSVDA